MRGKFIVLTGLDGSGTSSVATELHRLDRGSNLLNSIITPYTLSRRQIDEVVQNVSPAAHYLFYLSAVVYASCLVDEALEKGNVYCVRHLIDTVVSHRVAGLDVGLEYKTSLFRIPKPDFIIFLDVNEELRQERIDKRGKGYLDKKLDDDGFRVHFIIEFLKLSDHFVRIDVGNKSIAEIAQEVRSILKIDNS